MTSFDRKLFFDHMRERPFGGSLKQEQVDGMNFILDVWEESYTDSDLRWLSYALGTTMHETASTMQPIEEYGKGSGQPYGKKDPETGQTYYGRGFVQLTWRDNYARADQELDFVAKDSLEWHAERALDPTTAAQVMFRGMTEGWFRTHEDGEPETLGRYFNDETDDPYNAREIINGDKSKVPSWSGGVSIGKLIEGYHDAFLEGLEASVVEPAPEPEAGEYVTLVWVTSASPIVVKTEELEIMPSKTPKQAAAMKAAAAGKSKLGIPRSVGKEFVKADAKKGSRKK